MGLTSGVPDYFVAFPTKRYGGLYIEFKAPGKGLTPAQKDMIPKLQKSGYAVIVTKDLLEAIRLFSQYIKGNMDV